MEVTLGQTVYRTGRLSAMTQLHVTRRLSPCLGKLAPIAGMLKKDEAGDMQEVLDPIANALTVLSDEDVEFVINSCLDQAERKQGSNWAKVRRDGLIMFEDIALPAMLMLAYQTIRENLTDFFADPALQGLAGTMQKFMPTS